MVENIRIMDFIEILWSCYQIFRDQKLDVMELIKN